MTGRRRHVVGGRHAAPVTVAPNAEYVAVPLTSGETSGHPLGSFGRELARSLTVDGPCSGPSPTMLLLRPRDW